LELLEAQNSAKAEATKKA